MRTFFHFNEYGEDGPSLLAPLAIFSNQPVLWSPSGKLLQKSYDSGLTGISPDGLIQLVESGFVRIAARADWLVNGDSRRRSSWELSEYSNEFDGKILRILEEDATKPNPRVVSLGSEQGYQFADQAIEEQGETYQKAKRYVSEDVMPKGTKERVGRAASSRQLGESETLTVSIRELIRDAKNHADAAFSLNADISVDDNISVATALADIAGRQPSPSGSSLYIDEDRFKHAIEFAHRISGKEHISGLLAILADERERAQIFELMNSTLPFKAALRSQIVLGKDRGSVFGEIAGEKVGEHISGAVFAGGVALTAYSAAPYLYSKRLNRRSFLAGLFTSAVGIGSNTDKIENSLERLSFIPEADYNGPKWYFLLRCGTLGPARDAIEEHLETLINR
jgi:hypothetical protein